MTRNKPTHNRSLPGAQKRHQLGLSLVELMVAMVISLILMVGVSQIFMSSRNTYAVNEAMSRMQENARFATHFLAQDVRMAGYTGCGRLGITKDPTVLADPNVIDLPNEFFGGAGLQGFSDDWDNPTGITRVPNTDVVVTFGADGNELRMNTYNDNNANIQVVGDTTHIRQNDVLMITDCNDADIFAVTNNSSGNQSGTTTLTFAANNNINTGTVCPGRGNNQLCRDWGTEPSVMRFGGWAYFVGERDGRRSLYRAHVASDADPQELVENVESMRILYGESTANSGNAVRMADVFRTHDQVNDWEAVISVKIELVVSSDVRTPEPGLADFPVFGNQNELHSVTDEPNRLRRLVSRTITIRNRAL